MFLNDYKLRYRVFENVFLKDYKLCYWVICSNLFFVKMSRYFNPFSANDL